MSKSGLTYSLRPATLQDAMFVNELEGICMRAYAEALWGNWTPSVARYGFEPARHRILQVDGKDVGCVDLWRKDDHWFLDKLYLLPGVRGRGIGAELLRSVVLEARSSGMPLRLNVLTTNPRAAKFYEREGFCEVDRTPERISMEMAG